MSSPSAAVSGGPGGSKKAVHVKWAGKTIALGTFPSNEADEKCQKAKALTRAWRSTMRPKPSREWVMLELERLGVRVVSGRLGRKAGEEGDDLSPSLPENHSDGMPGKGANDIVLAATAAAAGGMMSQQQHNQGLGGLDRSNSLVWGSDADLNTLMARRNSSLGLSMMNDTLGRRGSLGSLGQVMGLGEDPTIPPHRPFVGGGAAAAYEAARHDHFTQKSAEQQRRAPSLGLGSLGGGLGGMGMSVNANQHYEMLKLHHMNLLNEIQETTLMMNLYQQQQLQQQQQQLQQQQASAEQLGGSGRGITSDSQLSLLMQQHNNGSSMDSMFQHRSSSLGLGGGGTGGFSGLSGLGGGGGSSGLGGPGSSMQNLLQQQQQQIQHHQQQLQKQQQQQQQQQKDQMASIQQQQKDSNGGGHKPNGTNGNNHNNEMNNNSMNNNNKRNNGGDGGAQPSAKRTKTKDSDK